ncbi:alpha/beta fold hydrolase [Streptomyces sp. NPDC018019]|uniref:alpha/beta fold hydrolase n=1 Tax=Streptomyces sp. NPDC018019 TaxID=3365030 RepID=UPI0037AFD6E4
MAELLATSADGVPIAALDDGQGPPLLLVHWGGGSARSWDGVAQALIGGFRVVRVARRIYTPGAVVPPSYSMALEAADVLAIAGLIGRPVLLVGHSSGAVAALEAAVQAPQLLAGLVLYDPPVPTRSLVGAQAARRARAALAAGRPREAMRLYLRDIAQEPAELVEALIADPRARAAFTAKAVAGFADIDAIDALGTGVDRFGELDVPTTLVTGDQSPAHLRARLADLAEILPNTQMATLAGQGHAAHLTAPEALAAVIRKAAGWVFG